MNQGELGVDCGGPCNRVCENQVKALKVFWARPVKVREGVYDVLAQVENKNLNYGIKEADYKVLVFDDQNSPIAEKKGKTFVNPNEKFILFETGLKTGELTAKKAFLIFEEGQVWEKAKEIPRNIFIERKEFVNTPRPRLHLKVSNRSLEEVREIEVVASLSDLNQTALGGSSTLIKRLKGGETVDVYLTWPQAFEVEPSLFDTYWRVNTFESQ